MNKTKFILLVLAPALCVPLLTQCGNQKDPDTIKIAVVSDTAEYKTMMNFVNKYKSIPGNESKKFKVVKMTNYHDYINNAFMYDELDDILNKMSERNYYLNTNK